MIQDIYLRFKKELLEHSSDPSIKEEILQALGGMEVACPMGYSRSFSLHVLDAFREALGKAIRLSSSLLKIH